MQEHTSHSNGTADGNTSECESTAGDHSADTHEILRGLELFCAPGEVHELRALKTRWRTVSGYYTDLYKMAADAARLSEIDTVPGVYFTPNPVDPTNLSFQHGDNYSLKYAPRTTSDSAILLRKWLLADFDPVREAGSCATNLEHDLAIARAHQAAAWLTGEMGWPAPIVGDSGNGAHLNFLVDLPNDEATLTLIKRILKALQTRFQDEHVLVDQTVANPARIWKVYGTMTRKGSASDVERPRRASRLLDLPHTLNIVTIERLSDCAALAPDERTFSKDRVSGGRKCKRFDIEAWLDEHDVTVKQAKMLNDGRMRYILEFCPFYPEHAGTSVAVFQTIGGSEDGKLGFKCHHDHCVDNHWEELRDLLEPSADGIAAMLGLGK